MEPKRFQKDVIINILASSISTAVLNLIIYPAFARYYVSEEYGQILTALGIVNILFSSIGNTLNNIRLIYNKNNEEENRKGTYNLLITFLSVFGAVIGMTIICRIFWISYFNAILLFFTIGIGILRAYYIVDYRLKLNYKKQLVSNIILSVGYLIGIFIGRKLIVWPLPFLLGETLSLIYTFHTSELIREPFRLTTFTINIIKAFILLMGCNILANVLVYLDRFVINPILGASNVSVYNVATFWGRCFGPFIAPISNVMLSYLSQKNSKIDIARYKRLFLITLCPIIVLCVLGFWGAPFLTGVLYPTLIQKSKEYIILSSIGVLLGYATSLISPIIMTVCSMWELFIMNMIQFLIYGLITSLGAYKFHLFGFCAAVLIVNLLKVSIFYYWGYYKLTNIERGEEDETSIKDRNS